MIVRGYAYREVRGRELFRRRDWAVRHGLTGPWRPFRNLSIRCQRLTQAVHLKKSYCYSVLARERDRADRMLGRGAVHSGSTRRMRAKPGGPRVEFIPTYNSQINLGAPPTLSADLQGDWPAFLAKYRFISQTKNTEATLSPAFSRCPFQADATSVSRTMWWSRNRP